MPTPPADPDPGSGSDAVDPRPPAPSPDAPPRGLQGLPRLLLGLVPLLILVPAVLLLTLVRRLLGLRVHPAWTFGHEAAFTTAHLIARFFLGDSVPNMRRALADPPARWKPAGAVHTRGVVGGRPAEIITPHGWVEGAPSILYLHGGGYGVGSPATHRALTTQLAVAAGFRCWVPHYRLAPEEPFPAAVDDAEAAWRELRAGTEAPCFVAGDSAGGGLTFALALRLKARGGPLPDGLVGLSPWTDLTMSGDSHAACAHADYLPMPLLQAFAGAYLGDGDRTAPEASPLCGELDGLPPCFVQHGGLEVLRWDSEELVRRLRAAGVDATLDAWPGMVHVFQAFGPLIPEGARAIERVGAWLKEQAAR